MALRKAARLVSFLLAVSVSFGVEAKGDSLESAVESKTKKYLVQFRSPEVFQNSAAMPMIQLFGLPIAERFLKVQMLVVESDDHNLIEFLRSQPQVLFVEEEIMHPAPAPHLSSAPASVASEAQERVPMAFTWGVRAVRAPEAWLTERGGQARVLVLDTGVDFQHESLATRFEAGRNFTSQGGPTDVTDLIGHGSHVSGTILADGADNGLIGVAPEARLLMGKVCTNMGCSSVWIVGGINWAIEQNVDVVNMSLGGSFISVAERQAYARAEAAGVFIAAASGNDGNAHVSFPAALPSITAVGAVDETLAKAAFSQWGPELDIVAPGVDVVSSVPRGTGRTSHSQVDLGTGYAAYPSLPFIGSGMGADMENELVPAGLGRIGDFTSPVAGKFALILRGDITFSEKVTNALNNGAVGVIIYNNAPGILQGTVTTDGSQVNGPVVMIEKSVGESALSAIQSGQIVRASISVVPSDYASLQGTSMATPHVAGVAALVRSANRLLTPPQVREILTSTATPMIPNPNNQFGSGMVNAEAAVAAAKARLTGELLRKAN